MKLRIKPVDENGLEINQLKIWKEKNLNKIYFDSKFEWRCWNKLKQQNIAFIYQPESINIIESFVTNGFKKNEIKAIKVQPMVYTPDFLIEKNNQKFYIECKGYFRKEDRYRFKLCQYTLHKNKGGVILIVMNDLEFDRAISCINSIDSKTKIIKL